MDKVYDEVKSDKIIFSMNGLVLSIETEEKWLFFQNHNWNNVVWGPEISLFVCLCVKIMWEAGL